MVFIGATIVFIGRSMVLHREHIDFPKGNQWICMRTTRVVHKEINGLP